MTDRELLELAAKAVGITLHVWGLPGEENFADISIPWEPKRWNPLTGDGDAFRLLVDLRITVGLNFDDGPVAMHIASGRSWAEPYGDDARAATRRAIVCVAAEIQRAKDNNDAAR